MSDTKCESTIRFTLAHELGHIVLCHTEDNEITDKEANCFATGTHKEILADKVIDAYKISMETDKTEELRQKIKSLESKQNSVLDMILEVGKKPSLVAKFESLELQISEYQEELNSAELAARHIPTRKEVIEWFAKLGGADPMQESVRRQVINTFIQKVFLWDNKAVIIFSLANTEETVAFEEIRDFESLIDDGSYSIVLVISLPKRFFQFEQKQIVPHKHAGRTRCRAGPAVIL